MKILRIKENKDGSATIQFELNQYELDLLKSVAKERGVRNTKKFRETIIKEALIKGVQ